MECRELALAPCPELVSGQQPLDPCVRVLLQPRRLDNGEGSKSEWELLHDGESVGTLARVGRAWLVEPDGSRVEVALKLRRDQPLGVPIDPDAIDARFWNEYRSHQRLVESDPSQPPRAIVCFREHRDDPAPGFPDIMPPCVLCIHARHAIPLRSRGELLREGEVRGFERRLRGDNAHDHWSREHHLDEILDESLGQDDSACGDCRLRPEGPASCREFVDFTNFYPNQFLMFPRWEGNLERTLQESNSERPLANPGAHLIQRLALAFDVGEGLHALHRAGIWHHDLNPENLCVRNVNGRLQAAIIDLGLSFDVENEERPNADPSLWPRRLSYAAWECRRDAQDEPIRLEATWTRDDEATFVLDQSDLTWLPHEPPICPGDRLLPADGGMSPIEVVEVRQGESEHKLKVSGPVPWKPGEEVEFEVERQRGPAADLFSFGMVMLALILDHPQGRPIRREVERAQDVLSTLPTIQGPDAPLVLASTLLTHPHAFSTSGRRFFRRRLDRYGPYGLTATRALGLAFSLALRGPASTGAATTDRRTSDAPAALRSVCGLIRTLYDDLKRGDTGAERVRSSPSPVRSAAKSSGTSSPVIPRSRRTLPEDWLAFLPYWHRPRWDGEPQKELLRRLDKRALPAHFRLTARQSETIQELQATRNAVQVIEEFLQALIAFEASRPRGVWAKIFQRSARAMPPDLAQSYPAALSALERLRHAPEVAQAWLVARQAEFVEARTRWKQRHSAWERVWLDNFYLRQLNAYWTDQFDEAMQAWRLTWAKQVITLSRKLQEMNEWWPQDLQRPSLARIADGVLERAARNADDLLREQLPELARPLMGPAGDVEAAWISQAARALDSPVSVRTTASV